MKLEEITTGLNLTGVVPAQIVSVVALVPHGEGALQLIYRTPDGAMKERLLVRADEPSIAVATAERPFSFDGDGAAFQLTCEAKRIDLAFLFDPMMAVHTSNVDPLPHQITAVYESLLPRQPLRFLLADRRAEAPWIALKQSQTKRRSVFHAQLAAMKEEHQGERNDLMKDQMHRLQLVREARLRDNARGLRAILYAIPPVRAFIASRYRKQDLEDIRAFRTERRDLLSCQRAEFEDLKRQARAIIRVEKRERRSLKTRLRRDFLSARSDGGFCEVSGLAVPAATASATPVSLMEFRINAEDLTLPSRPSRERKASDRTTVKPANDALASDFTQAVNPPPPSLMSGFTKAGTPPSRMTVKAPKPGPSPE